jgi:hypothetical protein
MRERRNAGAALIAIGGPLALILALYVSGYFLLSDGLVPTLWSPLVLRTYSSSWLADIYRPAAIVEGAIRGHEIETTCLAE